MSPDQLLATPEGAAAIAALAISFLASAAEAAIFHLPRQGVSTATRNRLRALLTRPHQISDVLRTLDFFADVGFLFAVGLLYARVAPAKHGLDLFLLTLAVPLLFLATEVVPRALAIRYPVGVVWSTLLPLELIYRALVPLSWGARRLSDWLLTPLHRRWGDGDAPDEEELRAVLGYSARRGALGQEGVEMVEGIFDLDDTRVQQVMTPRTQVRFLPEESTWEEALAAFAEAPYRRLPLGRGAKEEVVGILYAKDMLASFLKDERPTPREMAREPLFLPGVARLDDGLDRLREAGNQMAVVVDEYGGVEGLVTMEDLLEEIVGEIRDEHDEVEAREDACAVRRRGSAFDLDGSLEVEEFSDLLGVDFTDMAVETLGGLVFLVNGSMPAVGDVVDFRDLRFQVTERDGNRIARVHVVRMPGGGPG